MPRLRLIAGPNGSGKTTLARYLISQNVPLGQYINPDDIAKYIPFPEVLKKTAEALGVDTPLYDNAESFDATFAALLAQRIAIGLREEWVNAQLSLTYESVLSHQSHLGFVDQANQAGFESYLYYICTSDPLINQERVKQRVIAGGHDVPEDKIISRYENSLSLLYSMSKKCKRVYFFDNSGEEHIHFAEITSDGFLDIYKKEFEQIDASWFVEALLKKWPHNKIRLASP
ncbi:MAG: zeta toxin family protein [Gammaproteobacteria bacterium]|nr:zeta toxin family protein [Gammaproteobacteria bacterium]